jgi:hypothetical protein
MRLSLSTGAAIATFTLLGAVSTPSIGLADDMPEATDPALAPLLARVARHAEQFEEMKRRGSFTLNTHMDELDRGGHVDVTKDVVLRVTATPAERLTEIIKYIEDGADKTAEARKKAEKKKAEKKKDVSRDLHLPFLASEQARYVFVLAERDPNAPTHVRVAFKPKVSAENTFKGSAWIDEQSAEVLTMGFSAAETPTFVDRIDVTMRFDLPTPLGRAPSNVAFDVRGGFLVLRKHYRGTASISDARISF